MTVARHRSLTAASRLVRKSLDRGYKSGIRYGPLVLFSEWPIALLPSEPVFVSSPPHQVEAPLTRAWLSISTPGYATAVTKETVERVDLVADAMGIVSVRSDCTLGDALSMMVDRANVSHLPLDEIARAVVDGSIGFDE